MRSIDKNVFNILKKIDKVVVVFILKEGEYIGAKYIEKICNAKSGHLGCYLTILEREGTINRKKIGNTPYKYTLKSINTRAYLLPLIKGYK